MRQDDQDPSPRDRITLAGSDLLDYVKGLLAEGNIRRLIIRKPEGTRLLHVPLSAGIAGGGRIVTDGPDDLGAGAQVREAGN